MMSVRVIVLNSAYHRLLQYAKTAPGVEVTGLLMGLDPRPELLLVTSASAVRIGKSQSVHLAQAPRGSVGWFRSRTRQTRKPPRRDGAAHARLFKRTPSLFGVLAEGKVAFFFGQDAILTPVRSVELLDISMDQVPRYLARADWKP